MLVAQSLGGFTAPLVAERLPVSLIVLVAAMVPAPGESPGDWWANTGHVSPDPFDPMEVFLHDLPGDLAAAAAAHDRAQSGTPFEKPWPLTRWPDVPTRFLLCRDDRLFPASSPPLSCGGSWSSGSASRLTRWRAATSLLSPTLSSWRLASTATGPARRNRDGSHTPRQRRRRPLRRPPILRCASPRVWHRRGGSRRRHQSLVRRDWHTDTVTGGSRWALLVVGCLVSLAACDGLERGSGLERKGDVDAVIAGLGDALGLEDIFDDVHHRRTAPGCANNLRIDEDDAWYERNTFSIARSGRTADDVYATTVRYFRDAGFDIDQLLAPLSGSRGLRAIRDDLSVLIDFVGDGANLTITAGPCAVDVSPIGKSYDVVNP